MKYEDNSPKENKNLANSTLNSVQYLQDPS